MHKRWIRAALLVATWAAWGVSASQAQGPVLCMGDSITQGRAEFVSVSYPIRLNRNTGAATINAGVGGVTASYSLRVIDSLLAQHHPSYVLLLYGTNDINDPGKSMRDVAYVVLQAALRARAAGAIPVIGTIPPMVGRRAGEMSKVRTYNSYLRSYAAAYGIRLADVQAAFGSGAGLFVSDGFHPNDAGMEIIARTFGAHIPVLVLAPTGRTQSEEAAAGQSFAVTTALSWTVGGNPPWITIQSAAAGAGNGTVVYDVAENLGPARSGSIVVQGGGIGRPFAVSQAASPSLKIECAYGTPNPAVGTVWARRNTATNAGVAGSPIALGVGTQLACAGWTATGSAPKTGATTNTGPFILTNATTVTWQWRTNVWLETAAGPGGAVSVASGWFVKGSNVAVRALPAAGFKFVKWSGASASTAEAIAVGMTSTKSLAAEFAIATNSLAISSRYGVPEPAGTNWMRKDTTTNARVAGSPVALGVSTQLACVGWTATGSAPKTGAGTNTGPFALTNNTAIVWQWRTNVWLATAAGAGGAVSVASGWQGLGSNVAVRALPAAGFKFVKWSGASASTAPAIAVGMTSTKSLAAEFAIATNSLAASSRYGVPMPTGTNWMRKDVTTNAGVAGSPIALGVSTQLACVGWTATGSAPKTGAATNTGLFALTNNTTIVWQWRTNVWLATATVGNGSVSPASGWFGLGTPVALRATPAAGSRFFRWTGAASGTSSNASVAMTSAKAVTAWFGVDVTVHARGLDGSSKGVAVRATPADVFQLATGTTPRKFSYTNGTVVGLSAPAALPGGWKLVGWTGVDSWNGTNAIWTANASNLVTALYDPPPVVAITNPTTLASWTTTNRTLNLKGRASAFGGLVRIEASNARAERNRVCAGTTNWSCEGLTLYPGANPITVTAYDAYTNATTGTLAVTCSSKGLALMELALLSGNIVRDVQMPDNLAPGSVCPVRWQVEAYEPVVSGLKIRLPEGSGATNVTLNGRLAGTAPGSWTLGEWESKIYGFEADWTVPPYPGTCRIRFLAARQDGYAYLNANLPAGVDAAPYGMDGKEIARTIVPGGTALALQNETLFRDAKPFDTMKEVHRRAGIVVRNVSVPDNLVPGSVVTCRWTLLSYPPALSRLRFDLPAEASAYGTGTVARTTNGVWQVPAGPAIAEFDATAANDALGPTTTVYKTVQRDMQYVWTVPNDPGTCRIAVETAMYAGSNWIRGVLREGVDGRIEAGAGRILRDVEETGAAPTVLELGKTNLTGNVRYAGDANWFVFTAAISGTYRIQTTLGTLPDTILKLYGPGTRNDLVAQNDNAVGWASRLVLPLAPGTYYVKITAPPPRKGTFRLVAALEP